MWCEVRLNLPCSEGYDPSLPCVLILTKDRGLATRQATMMDNIHAVVLAQNQLDARAPCHQIKLGMNSLRNQASDRKYRQPSTGVGVWNDSIIATNTPFPRKFTTGKKWLKLKDELRWLCAPE